MLKSNSYKDSLLDSDTTFSFKRHRRLMLVAGCFLICMLLLVGRLIQLHITHNDFLQAQGNARTLRTVDIPSYRGMITDRRGVPIAISTPVHTVWANPQHFVATKEQCHTLARLLKISDKQLAQKMEQHADKNFVYLKRHINPETTQAIEALNIPGIEIKREFRRYYPSSQQVAQLVGFTDIDDVGLAGLELGFEPLLKPTIGKKRVLEDRTGRVVKDIELIRAADSGQDIALSIDLRIQGIAYRELEQAVKKTKAKSATLVMLNVQTGEVIAMVSAPAFNPNNRREYQGNQTRNRALTDLLEPGSTIKPFTIAAALEHRLVTADTIIDTSPGYYRLAQHQIRDVRNFGPLTVKDVLTKSSNVGISKIVENLPSATLLQTFEQLGFGDHIQTPFPGERHGMLPAPTQNAFVHATHAFGYGISVTPIQIAQAYATLANRGIKHPISLIKLDPDQPISDERVLSQSACNAIIDMLSEVLIDSGTGSRANIPGYKTAGKTGTVRIVGPHGYDRHRHIGLFAGITPVDEPYLATLIIVEEPDESAYYGGLVAAPIYKNVLRKALHILNIPPDNVASLS